MKYVYKFLFSIFHCPSLSHSFIFLNIFLSCIFCTAVIFIKYYIFTANFNNWITAMSLLGMNFLVYQERLKHYVSIMCKNIKILIPYDNLVFHSITHYTLIVKLNQSILTKFCLLMPYYTHHGHM